MKDETQPMTLRTRLLFGPWAALTLCLAITGLGALVPGYNQVRQTVSEIGEVGSPMRVPFAFALCLTAVCLFIFASALWEASQSAGYSKLSAYIVAVMGVCAAGIGVFAFPHPLHNVFGISELVGYQAPLIFALTWRRHSRSPAVGFSWIMYALVVLALIANLSVLDRRGALWAYERPIYGLVQRALFAVTFLWCAGIGIILRRRFRSAAKAT